MEAADVEEQVMVTSEPLIELLVYLQHQRRYLPADIWLTSLNLPSGQRDLSLTAM